MKNIVYLIFLTILVGCNNEPNKELKLEKNTELTDRENILEDSVADIIVNNNSGTEDENKIFYDTIEVFDDFHKVFMEFYSMSEFSFRLVKVKNNKTDTLISKTNSGCFFDTILIKDYNFDNVPDFDLISAACNRSGANTIHHIYLNQDSIFTKLKFEHSLNIYPVREEEVIYGGYNGVWDFSVYKAKWIDEELIIQEEHSFMIPDDTIITTDRYFDECGKLMKEIIDTVNKIPDWDAYYSKMKRN